MKSKYKPLLIGIAILFLFDLAAIITMIANPDLTARVIPVLFVIQLLGVIGIPAVYLTQQKRKPTESQGTQSRSSKEWLIWLFSGLAVIYLFRALLTIGYMAFHGWHKQPLLGTCAGMAITCYLLYLAFAIRNRTRKKNHDRQGDGEQSEE